VLGNRPEILDDVDRALAGEEFSAVREINSRMFQVWYTPLKASTGEVYGVIGAAVDITERKRLEEWLARLAYYDSLTNLPNRALFVERLEEALGQTVNSRAYVAVVTLDLDDFRIINTSLGHEAGDRLLVAVAERLRRVLDAGDTVARLGGDTFAVLIRNMSGTEEAIEVVERIGEHIQTPISLQAQEVSVTASIGVALGIGTRSQPKVLLGEADTAMSWAKYKGKAQSEVFDPSVMDARASERLALERDLRTAITTDELVLRYQPDILLDTDHVVGMMALLHWEHPERGLMTPSEFIPIAEGSRLVLSIGQRILREACWQAVEWQERHQCDPPFMMCVDLSARQFRQRGIAEEVATLLRQTGLEPRSLNLRISESVAMKDARHTISTLEKLKSHGVQLSINNFGTGYSSLRYLNRFPVDFLVIDSSFVRNLWEGSADATVVSGMISLAHALGISAAAEGVETRKQVTLLRGMGCNLVRGEYFSPPLTREAASQFLASSNHRDHPEAE
jgi:diguanylate cyclase (GGDEF)-like protein